MAALKVTASRDLLNQVTIHRKGLSRGGGGNRRSVTDKRNGSDYNGSVTIRQSLSDAESGSCCFVGKINNYIHLFVLLQRSPDIIRNVYYRDAS